MVISDTSYMIGGFTIALLTAEFGQVWAEYVCHDLTPQLRSSAKRKDGGTNMMITYDVTPQQRDGWQNQLITYDATKMNGAYSDGISSITPLFH